MIISNIDNVTCLQCYRHLLAYVRVGKHFQRQMPIFKLFESQNIWRAKTKNKKLWVILIILLYFVQIRYFIFSCEVTIKTSHSNRFEASTVP